MAGRGKKKEITPAQMRKAERYARRGNKNNTIATLMGWDHNLIEQRPDIKKRLTKKRAEREDWLHGIQDRQAKSFPAMSIFLGKNELEQTDKQETKHSGIIGTRELSKAEMAALVQEKLIPSDDAIAK